MSQCANTEREAFSRLLDSCPAHSIKFFHRRRKLTAGTGVTHQLICGDRNRHHRAATLPSRFA